MKASINKFMLLAGAVFFLLYSCKKEENRAILKPGTSNQLTGSSNAVVLDSTKNSSTAVTFSWSAVDYNYPAVVTYTLQFDASESDSFKNATNFVLPVNALSKSFTVQDFNTLAYQTLQLAANTASPIWVRVKADINQNGVTTGPTKVPTVYSNVYNMTVTPYQIVIIFPTLNVPGDYQGWNPSIPPYVASVYSNNIYEGYVYIPKGGTYQFKFAQGSWTNNWGDAGGSSAIPGAANASVQGKLLTNGGNILAPGGNGGYYKMNADLNALTYQILLTTWGVIGDATPGGWSTDTPMTFDPISGTWSVTVNLVSTGTFKFRANSDWTWNFGYDKGALDYNGSNIPVPATGSGSYTITLDLSNAGNYTYSIKHN